MIVDKTLSILEENIRLRWKTIDLDKFWPWVQPCHVRVCLYAEGALFDGGSFHGLKHVIATLRASPWYWVKFDVTTVSRGTDPSAMQQNKNLDQLDLVANFDQIWFFGVSGGNLLSAGELTAVTNFMAQGGGVLVTGDHADLGQGIAGSIPRAGKMRLYPAPPAAPPGWNTTLVQGHDGIYDFSDQSDDIPQTIRPRRYPLWDLFPSRFSYRWAPHPVLCGIDGPIDVLPDHEHEGEAIIPASFPAAEWPSKNGFQPKAEVIAWGRIKDPSATNQGHEIGVISAYDGHRADIGRVVADATWHHFFDINLLGDPTMNPTDLGFGTSPAGQVALKKIEAYYLNIGVWLASPEKQTCMRNALSWGIIWHNRFLELSTAIDKIPIWVLGEQALDALGRVAPQCTRRGWIFWELIPVSLRMYLENRLETRQPLPKLLEEFLVGTAIKRLIENHGYSKERPFPGKQPKDSEFDKIFAEAVPAGLNAMNDHYLELAATATEITATAGCKDKR
jgi:hypothetical protein